MSMFRNLALIAVASFAMAWVVGCEQEPTPSEAVEETAETVQDSAGDTAVEAEEVVEEVQN